MRREERKQLSPEEWQQSQEAWQEYITSLFNFVIERRRQIYVRTRNPIHALDAYRAARAGKIDIPSWILEVFDDWAAALCVSPPKGAKEIAAALGLATKGGPSITAQAENDARDWWIAERVLVLLNTRPKCKLPVILDQVAEEYDLSSERVTSIWYELTPKRRKR
jgi:hypothetical protein